MKFVISVVILTLFTIQNIFCNTIVVPNDQPTIQAAIDSSSTGDTVLVSPGTYLENINFKGKSIVLGSLFLTTSDITYISQTIIDGNQQGCVVVLENGEDSTTVLSGFTITNGYTFSNSSHGGGITVSNKSNPLLAHLIVKNNMAEDSYGGGILCRDSSRVLLKHSIIKNNSSDYGGGIAIIDVQMNLDSNDIKENISSRGGGIYLRSSKSVIENCLISKNTAEHAQGGGILATYESEIIIENSEITENKVNQYVVTISYPSGGGIEINRNSSAIIQDCLINNNSIRSAGKDGGGICVLESSLVLKRSQVVGNDCGGESGAGIHIFGTDEKIIIEDVIICDSQGGGLYLFTDGLVDTFQNVVIKNNGGHGLETNLTSYLSESNNVSIFLNRAKEFGSDIYLLNEDTISTNSIYLDTTTVTDPDEYHLFPYKKIDLHYKHAMFQSSDSDLFVSPNGSDSNSGTSKENPLKTINTALIVAKCDEFNNRVINLDQGIYSKPTNGEIFPIYSRDNVSIKGDNADSTILIGNGSTRIIESMKKKNISFENLTVQNGYGYYGGGIAASGDGIKLQNLVIKDNTSEARGAGIYFSNSSRINLINITVVNNTSISNDSSRSGGVSTIGVSQVSIINSIITNNIPTNLSLYEIPPPLPPHIGFNNIIIANSNIGGGRDGIYIDGDSIIVNWLEDNIDEDPQFVGGDPFDYNLTDTSPCINAGTPFLVWEGDTLINLSPDEYVGEAPDMGALESDVLISVEGIETPPNNFELHQNYPNPFNNGCVIQYSIPEQSQVELKVYDVLGREVATLVNLRQSSGTYEINFDASNLGSGVYFYQIRAGKFVQSKKMLLLK